MPHAPAHMTSLDQRERQFVVAYVEFGNLEQAKAVSGYHTSTDGSALTRRHDIALAIRAEIMRRLATEGAQIGFASLKRIARDTKLPAAAQATAARTLLQAAGLLESKQEGKEAKSINDMSRDELRDFIAAKQSDIEKMEAALADRAEHINPRLAPHPLDSTDDLLG